MKVLFQSEKVPGYGQKIYIPAKAVKGEANLHRRAILNGMSMWAEPTKAGPFYGVEYLSWELQEVWTEEKLSAKLRDVFNEMLLVVTDLHLLED